jgi:adenylosuccinate synthase
MNPTVTVIVGGFFGDEGKGRIVAALAARLRPAIVARGGVGTNAGHTIVFGDKKFGIRQVPSAAFDAPDALLAIGPGVVVDPEVTAKEIKDLGLNPSRLLIDSRCAVISEEHRNREKADEHLMKVVGSTGSGSGMAIADHVLRKGPIARDWPSLKEYIGDVPDRIHQAILSGRPVLIEGTQATFLSNYFGDYPFTTSKDVCASSLCADVGVGPKHVKDVVVVFKAYVTRVGQGHLEGELSHEETVKRGWAEFGVVTGRARRAAEFSVELARKACMLNSATCMAITKLDVLFPECTGVTSKDKLSEAALAWIREKEEKVGVPCWCIGTGPDAQHTVWFY